MKRFLCLILSLITVMTLASCSKSNESDIPTGMVVGKQTSAYTLYLPDGWIIQPELHGIVLAYASTADKSSISFSCADSKGMGADEYFKSHADEYTSFDSFTLEKDNVRVSFGNDDARSYEFTFKDGEDLYRATQTVCVSQGNAYILTYLAKDSSKYGSDTFYNSSLQYAEKVRESFRLSGNDENKTELAPFEDESAPDNMMLISDTKIVDYKLYVPNDWKIGMQSGYTGAYLDDGTSVGVSYYIPSANNISEYKDELFSRYAKIYKDFTELSEERITLSGIESLAYTYTASYANKSIKATQIFTIKGSYVYTVTYTAPLELFDSHADEFSKITESYRFK
ncbi:MAG: hypothetical protein SOZ62_04720 [Eubacteriales bacterium]|nr:hypothetical protein [Eubacteriales bacterium]